MPVIETVAVRRRGIAELQAALDDMLSAPFCGVHEHVKSDLIHLQRRAREIATAAVVSETPVRRWTHRLDAVLLHPVARPDHPRRDHVRHVPGGVRLERGARSLDRRRRRLALGSRLTARFPAGLLRSLVVDGAIAGVGAVITFLPQILILFFFILLLEGTGYMVRAAFLMDRLMHGVGLSGPRLHPLAVELRLRGAGHHGDADDRRSEGPADDHPRRAADDLLGAAAGLHADHRRLHSRTRAWSGASACRALVMFGLYITGIAGALLAALVLRRGVLKGSGGGFMMELPKYQWPPLKDVAIGLLTRAQIFLKRAGTIILGTTIILWALASIPQAGPGPEAERRLDRRQDRPTGIETVVRPIGFNHDISMALLPAMAAREVAVSAIATVYSIDSPDEKAGATKLEDSSSTAGRSRRRSPSSPGSCSRRSASRPSPSPGARPTAGSGRCSWSAICSSSPMSLRARPTGRRSRWVYSCPREEESVTWRA